MIELEPTEFQLTCESRVKTLLRDAGFDVVFTQIRAAEDVLYMITRIDTAAGQHLQIYIYEDDAGFFVDERWIICEHQDFKTSSELIDKFCATLQPYLESSYEVPPG